MPTDHNAATRRRQGESLNHADHHREPWDPTEVELLLEPSEAHALAALLGRTVYAVQSARDRLARGESLGGGNAPASTPGRSTPASRALQAWAPDDPRWDA